MPEMTTEQVKHLTEAEIIQYLRRAAQFQQENKAITWEHGADLVSIVAIHGVLLARALEVFDEPRSMAEAAITTE